MEKFVRTVNAMDETILVPCRLMDMKVGDGVDPSAKPKKHPKNTNDILENADLFDVYNMLNSIKADLLWGQGQGAEEETSVKGHARRPSTASVASTGSSTISDSESEAGNENDSGIEEGAREKDRTEAVAQNFRRHLQGLSRCIKQMTEAAQYVTSRYQQDIGGAI